MSELQEYLKSMLLHIDDMAKQTIFMLGMERGIKEATKQKSDINNGSFSTETEKKMLINMTGISINAKPRADGRFQGYAMRDGEKKYFYGKTTAAERLHRRAK